MKNQLYTEVQEGRVFEVVLEISPHIFSEYMLLVKSAFVNYTVLVLSHSDSTNGSIKYSN